MRDKVSKRLCGSLILATTLYINTPICKNCLYEIQDVPDIVDFNNHHNLRIFDPRIDGGISVTASVSVTPVNFGLEGYYQV